MNLGDNIRKYRRRINLTQEQLAEAVGVHSNTIRKWEKGLSSPSATELKLIADSLKTTTDSLYDDANSQTTFIKNSAYQDKTEIHDSVPSMAYWGSLVDNAEKTAENGKNLHVIIDLVKTTLNILEEAINKHEHKKDGYIRDVREREMYVSQFVS